MELYRQLREKGYKVKCTTYNQSGVVFGFDVLQYPKDITFPKTVFELNHYLHDISKSHDFDLLLLNIGGGCTALNSTHHNCFGALHYAYYQAVDMDCVILCVNPAISTLSILRQINFLQNIGIPHIEVVACSDTYDFASLDDPVSISLFSSDENRYSNYLRSLQNELENVVYTLNEVENGKLVQSILQAFE